MLKAQNGAIASDVQLFNEMLYIDALRGWDSTGVASFHKNGDLRAIKAACEAQSFIRSPEWDKYSKELIVDGKAILGHNRKSTVGKTTDETAHPFIIDNQYAFMHNGTLRDHKKLFDTEVDSEALGMHLTRLNGAPKAIEEALGEVEGAYACMWIDPVKEAMYLLRNKERPLYLAHTPIGYIIASEYGFIVAAALRARVKCESIKEIDVDTLYTIDLSTYNIAITEDKLTIPKKALPLRGPVAITATTTGGVTTEVVGKFCEGEVSKNAFKKIKKCFLGSIQTFWMADYNALRPNDKYPTEWVVWGDSENLTFEHQFRGIVKHMPELELASTFDCFPCVGRIVDMEYDMKNKQVLLIMSEVDTATPDGPYSKQYIGAVTAVH